MEKVSLNSLGDIYCLNQSEAKFLYEEIFNQEIYSQKEIHKNDIVLDVGANIGLFALYASAKGAEVYSFEPINQIFDILKKNTQTLKNIKTFNTAISDMNANLQVNYYPNYTIMSGILDQSTCLNILKESINAKIEQENDQLPESFIEKLALDKLGQKETKEVKSISLSHFIKEQGLSHIHLLKIDIEGGELSALRGIQENHFKIIEKILIEVHQEDDLNEASSILKKNNFDIEVINQKHSLKMIIADKKK